MNNKYWKKIKNEMAKTIMAQMLKESETDDLLKSKLEVIEKTTTVQGWELMLVTTINRKAREYLEGQSGAIKDDVVFGWARHEIIEFDKAKTKHSEPIKEDDDIEDNEDDVVEETDRVETKSLRKEKAKPKNIEDLFGGFDLFNQYE